MSGRYRETGALARVRRSRRAAGLALAVAAWLLQAAPARGADTPAPTEGAVAGAPSRQASGAPAAESVSVAYGPSLARLLEHRLAPEFTRLTGVAVAGEPQPSLAELRLTTASGAPIDVALTTDPALVERKVTAKEAPYYLVFAANAMVVGYRSDSPYGRAIAAGRPWFEALRVGGVRFGRLDPALDPLGARALFVLQLARRFYETADLEKQILQPHQIVAAADLLPKLQRGELDVALLYRSQAVEAGLKILDLPVEINLADPGRRGVYAEASLEIGGDLVRGAPLVLAAVPLAAAPHAAASLRFADFLSSHPARRILDADGFVVLPEFPLRRAWGQAP